MNSEHSTGDDPHSLPLVRVAKTHHLRRQQMLPEIPSGVLLRAPLPLPPGINQSFKIVHVPSRRIAGKTVQRLGDTPELAAFKQKAWRLLTSGSEVFIDHPLLEMISGIKDRYHVGMQVSLMFYFQTLWRRDVDGGEKHVIDIAFSRLQLNDNAVLKTEIEKTCVQDDHVAYCTIEISTIGKVYKK